MNNLMNNFKVFVFSALVGLTFTVRADAIAMGPGSGMMTGSMMSNGGSFGMMNGMAGSPVIGEDGTAYLVSYVPTSSASLVPSSNSFESKLIAVTPSGTISSMTMNGIVSKPVVLGDLLFASASLPDFNDYTMFGSFGINPPNNQSVFYIVKLPLTGSAKPIAVALDGSFASAPVVDSAGKRVVVTTTDFGNSMMSGSYSYNMMYGSYNANASTAKTYLYMINFDGTFTRITIQ